MKKLTTIKLVALLLVFVMLLSAVSCFDDDTPTTTKPSTSTTTTTGKPNGPDDPPAHVCVFGEWEVIKEATNTEDGLRERRCECGEVEQEVIEASGKEYYIQYRNLKTAEYPKENGYNSKEGLLNLPIPEAEGYVFIGWYTASIGGELVDYIPEGSKQNYILFAHWELISYEITYKNAPNNTNVTSYDIEDKLKLETPKWSGLVFTHWSDEEGNIYKPSENITVLPERMHGDLVLTANWKVLRNIATPAGEDAVLKTSFVGEDGFLYFFYDLGTIEHVVLDDIDPKLYYKAEGMQASLTLSKTVSISDEKAESISNTISKSISSTRSWSESTSSMEYLSKKNNNTIGFNVGGSLGGDSNDKTDTSISGKDFNIKNVVSKVLGFSVKAEVEGKFDWSKEEDKTTGWTKSNYGEDKTSEESSNTVINSIAYKNEITSEIVENYSISADLPSGYYAYVHAGNIRVIAVVSYEIATGYMYLNTYSRLDNMHAMMMYYPTVNELNNPSVEGLDFTIPEDEIVNMIENSYYIKYDANGGTGTMPTTMHTVGGNEKLAKNEFTRPGYVFAGWELTTDNGVTVLQDGQTITDLGKPLETVTLKAMWTSTEPVWVEKESGSFLFADFPSGFDTNNSIYKSMEKEAYTEFETETTKRVVTIEKVGYVYWHWMYDTVYNPKDGGCEQRTISDVKRQHGSSNYKYYFVEFYAIKSTLDCPAYSDRSYVDGYEPGKAPITYNARQALLDQGILTAQDGLGTPRMLRFEYYRCTYTDYELAN